jgi:cytochrome c peroxidase
LPSKLAASGSYPDLFSEAFGDARISMDRIAKAMATFERCMISGNSPYDRFSRGDSAAITPAAQRGLAIFRSDNAKCATCHSGVNFTDDGFHSTGLFGFYVDGGRFGVTGRGSDYGKFHTPSLRNVALSAPYEHNGQFLTLKQVLDHYNVGGKHNSTQDSLIHPLHLSDGQIDDLIAFLHSLTDTSFTNRVEFGPE